MPGKVKVKIVAGRGLPIMDRSNLTTDAYVEVKMGSTVYKTDVYRKSLNPAWNSEWFRFEMDDLELQDEPLQIRLMDHDTYSSNDAIGKVYLDLNPLLCNSSRGKDTSGKTISGWIPVYDTMHGIRGEVNLIVKVELFSDLNKFRQSSCGVRFFFTQSVPEGYVAHSMQGFVEELVVNDDPEYQWIDKIRTPRASNEARQTLFSKLSGEVQRKVGLKALELGGNAVIGYKQCFDLEGESGIVVRGMGTAACLTKQYESQLSPSGDLLGISRECGDLHGYHSFSKNSRSLRRRGGPGRAPRLHRRSFKVPSSSDSVSELQQQSNEPHKHIEGKGRLLVANAPGSFKGESDGLGKVGSTFERSLPQGSSFRQESLLKLVKLKKSLTSATHSLSPTKNLKSSCSAEEHNKENLPKIDDCNDAPANKYSITALTKTDKGMKPASSTSTTFLLPKHNPSFPSISPTHRYDAAASKLRSSSPRLSRNASEIESKNFSVDNFNQSRKVESIFEEPNNSSQNSLPSSSMHVRTHSDSLSPAKSSLIREQDNFSSRSLSKSVNELNTSERTNPGHFYDFMGSEGGFESAGSNLDSNEDSTSDTSTRYIFERGSSLHSQGGRLRGREIDFESDTSKEFAKLSSGNEGCSIDNDDLSPVSEREGFLLLKKKRGSRRKDRFSKTSLVKRASANFSERGYLFSNTTEKLREEVVKFFKRKKSSDDNESCSSSTKNASTTSTVKKCSKTKSPYRETKFLFRRRRTTSSGAATKNITSGIHNNSLVFGGKSRSFGQLFRSNSDSHSLGQTSLDSMPSIGSEPLFDQDENDPLQTDLVLHPAIITPTIVPIPSLKIKEEDEEESSVQNPSGCESDSSANVIKLGKNEVVEIIEELGYSTESPINLYISSMDALLVYDPLKEESSSCAESAVVGGSSSGKFCSSACHASANCKQPVSASLLNRSCNNISPCHIVNIPINTNYSGSSITSNPNTSDSLSISSGYPSLPQVPSSAATTDSFISTTTETTKERRLDSFDVLYPNVTCSNTSLSLINESKKLESKSTEANTEQPKAITRPLISIHDTTQSLSSFKNDENKYLSPGNNEPIQKEQVLMYMSSNPSALTKESAHNLNLSDEEILVVMHNDKDSNNDIAISNPSQKEEPVLKPSSSDAKMESKENRNICQLHANIEKLDNINNRSPIPEELLYDRATPTGFSMLPQHFQTTNFLTGSTTITNYMSSHQTPIPISTNNQINSNNNHNVQNVSVAQPGKTLNSSSTNDAPCDVKQSSSKNGSDDHSNRNDYSEGKGSTSGAGVNSDDSVIPNPSLSKSHPVPQYPTCDPQHYHCQANGCPINHRLQHLHQQQGYSSFSQEMSVDVDAGENGGDCLNGQSNGRGTVVKPIILKAPGYVATHPIHKLGCGGGPSPFLYGATNPNMTTTIITSGTGTIPMVMGAASGPLHRRSSESDLSTPPKPTLPAPHTRNFPGASGMKSGITTTVDQYGLMEYPFITISQFPPNFLTHIGGTVTARSVKLLERISNLEEPESRDAWWNEIRMEIRAHCRAFGCTVVVGYEEHTSINDDVCVLSASGTAAIAVTTIGLKTVELLTVSAKHGAGNSKLPAAPCPGRGVEKERSTHKADTVINTTTNNGGTKHMYLAPTKLRHDSDGDFNCSMLHIPSNPAGLPFPVKMSKCIVCRKGRVPDVLIVTCDIPPGLHITGKGTLIQAQVFRPKKDCKGETSAKEVSDSLPFLEYELHRRLINKLKVKGMNAIFGLKVQICLGDKLMVALATGTAMYVTALPPPGVPIITAGNLKTDAQKVLQYQKVVQDAYDRNRQHYDLKGITIPTNGRLSGSSGEESEEEDGPEIPNTSKDTYILEVDDAEDIDIISMLIDPHPQIAFFMNNIDYLHGYEEHNVTSQQMFTQVWRCRVPTVSLRQFTAYFERLIRSVCFKLRKMMPCVLSKLSFRVELPEPDEMQISIIGLALGMTENNKLPGVEKSGKSDSSVSVTKEENELIFPLEEDGSSINLSIKSAEGASTQPETAAVTKVAQTGILAPAPIVPSTLLAVQRHLSNQPTIISSSPHSHILSGNNTNHVLHETTRNKVIVQLTPLPYIPGWKIERYLGNLNFFFIRETTSIRENGGLSGFVHNFVSEILAIVRAHVAALGGNAMVSYFMTELSLLHNPHKNQGQCLINVGGDVVLVVNPLSASEETHFGS